MRQEETAERFAEIERKTGETSIAVALAIDGAGSAEIHTGIGFFDHMLEQVAFHAKFDLTVQADGDLHVDEHHTIEDIGICLGKALNHALGAKRGIARYGSATLPMDDALVLVSLDFCGRSLLNFDVEFTREMLGELPTELIEEFFLGLTRHCGLTLHVKQLAGRNTHHVAEAVFKAFGRSLGQAVSCDANDGLPSTKGIIE